MQFYDSFMRYATADLDARYNSASGTTLAVQPAGGRTDAYGTRGAVQLAGGSIVKTLTADADWKVGFAFQTTALVNSNIIRLQDGGTTQIEFNLVADGTVRITRNGTTLASSSYAISTNTWYYFECQGKINNAAGTAEIRINGSSRVTFAGDTQNTVNATANQAVMANQGAASVFKFADLFVRNSTHATVGFRDDTVIYVIDPDADAFYTDWTPSTVGDNYKEVNKTAPDMATYVSSNVAGNRDSYNFTPIGPATATIYGVQLTAYAEKDDGAVRELEFFLRFGGAPITSGTVEALNNTPTYYSYDWPEDPDAMLPWDVAAINALEAGFEQVT